MAASFACMLGTVRNAFIQAGVAHGDVNNEVDFQNRESVSMMSTKKHGGDNDSAEKGNDSDCAEPYSSDSTNWSHNDNSDCDSASSFEEADMLQQVTAECCPDENQRGLEVKQSCLVTSDEQADIKTSSEPITDIKSPPQGGRQSEAEIVESSIVFSVGKGVSAERARWADIFDDPDDEDCSSEFAGLGTGRIEANVLPSKSEADDPVDERKIKRTQRRRSLIDKAITEQENPTRSKLRSSAPVFVPMALEAKATADGKKLCLQCGGDGEQNHKFCKFCGTPFPANLQMPCGTPFPANLQVPSFVVSQVCQ